MKNQIDYIIINMSFQKCSNGTVKLIQVMTVGVTTFLCYAKFDYGVGN